METRSDRSRGGCSHGLLTIKAVAKLLGFDRRAVAAMCRSGELGYVPCRGADGKPSRIHKRVAMAEVERWIERNTVRSQDDMRRAVDGRRTR